MSNYFGALDDSGDEGGAPAPAVSKKTVTKKAVVPPSKTDERKKPNHNDRNTKFGRGGRAPTRDGKRAYDRHSGTGRGKEVKKGGGGAHNWGSDQNEARDAEGAYNEEAAPAEDATNNEEVAAEEVPAEPEVQTLSYEEYLANKQRPDNEAFKPVKEPEVDSFFSKAKPRTVAEEEDFLVMSGGKAKRKGKKNSEETDKVSADLLGFRSGGGEEGRGGGRGRGRGEGRGRGRGEGRGGRGGRGEGRGGRGRGDRGGRGRGEGRGAGGRGRGGGRGSGRGGGGGRGLNVNDQSAFPSL